MPNAIIPPAPGIENDMYLAYPVGPNDPSMTLLPLSGTGNSSSLIDPGNNNLQLSADANKSGDLIGDGTASGTVPVIGGANDPVIQGLSNMLGLSLGGDKSGFFAWLTDWFGRGLVIVLGFIFVAVGLMMLHTNKTAVQVLANTASKVPIPAE